MVRLQKLAKLVSKAIKACANVLIAAGIELVRFAERLEKRSSPK